MLQCYPHQFSPMFVQHSYSSIITLVMPSGYYSMLNRISAIVQPCLNHYELQNCYYQSAPAWKDLMIFNIVAIGGTPHLARTHHKPFLGTESQLTVY